MISWKHHQISNFEKKLQTDSIECSLTGEIYQIKEGDFNTKYYLKKVVVFEEGQKQRTQNVLVTFVHGFEKGDRIQVLGTASCFSHARNPGGFDAKDYYTSVSVGYQVKADTAALIQSNQNLILYAGNLVSNGLNQSLYRIADEKYASVFSAMILGIRDNLDQEISNLFSICGIGHILSISGLHISLIGLGLYGVIRRFGGNYLVSMVICTLFILFYGLMTGNGVSTVRALIMFIIAVYGNVVGRTYDVLSATCLSGILILMEAPCYLYNSAFLLSFGAMIGIVVTNDTLSAYGKLRNPVLKSLALSAGIQLVTLPITLYYFYAFPVYSVILNVIIIPLATLVMICGILGSVLGAFHTLLGCLSIGPGVLILMLYEDLCWINLKIPWAVWVTGQPKMWQIIAYYLVLIIVIQVFKKSGKAHWMGLFIPMIIIITLRINNYFVACFLDVGQGDGIYLGTPQGIHILIDGGSADQEQLYQYTLRSYLLYQGVHTLDYGIITHCDNDHISGMKELIQTDFIHVKNLLLPDTNLKDEAYQELVELAIEHGVKIHYISAGFYLHMDRFSIDCIHPALDFMAEDRNSYSTTLLVKYDEFQMLLTGDIGAAQEKLLLPVIQNLGPIQVLKAGHHGSGYSSSTEFLEAVKPLETVISCGYHNRYGHPHLETLERLYKIHTNIRRTDYEGAILYEIP